MKVAEIDVENKLKFSPINFNADFVHFFKKITICKTQPHSNPTATTLAIHTVYSQCDSCDGTQTTH